MPFWNAPPADYYSALPNVGALEANSGAITTTGVVKQTNDIALFRHELHTDRGRDHENQKSGFY
jgi:hypothetical protein